MGHVVVLKSGEEVKCETVQEVNAVVVAEWPEEQNKNTAEVDAVVNDAYSGLSEEERALIDAVRSGKPVAVHTADSESQYFNQEKGDE